MGAEIALLLKICWIPRNFQTVSLPLTPISEILVLLETLFFIEILRGEDPTTGEDLFLREDSFFREVSSRAS